MSKFFFNPTTGLLTLGLLSTALALSIERDVVVDYSSSGNSSEIHAILNKTMSAMGGSNVLDSIRTISYHAET
jgi:hypothetical protein